MHLSSKCLRILNNPGYSDETLKSDEFLENTGFMVCSPMLCVEICSHGSGAGQTDEAGHSSKDVNPIIWQVELITRIKV